MTYATDRPLSALKRLVLDCLSPERTVPQASLDALSDKDWVQVMHMVGQHRIGPIMGWQIKHHHPEVKLPHAIQVELDRQFQQSTLRNLAMQRDLLAVHRLLDGAGIPHLLLKGPFLAQHCYPQPGLRPMRDLDFLVPPERALDAFNLLLNGGLTRHEKFVATPEAVLEAQYGHHLPPLKSPSGLCAVEVHPRVLHHDILGKPVERDVSTSGGYWQRTAHLALGGVPCEGVTDLLLHLLIHAVYDHQFNNGPLLLSDVGFLLERYPIDWPLFWQMADEWEVVPGCAMGLSLVGQFWPNVRAATQYPNGPVVAALDQGVLGSACELMLQEMDSRADIGKFVEEGSKRSKWRYVLSRPFPSKATLAARHGGDHQSWNFGTLCLRYLAHWRYLVVETAPRIWSNRRGAGFLDDVQNLRRVNQWLSST